MLATPPPSSPPTLTSTVLHFFPASPTCLSPTLKPTACSRARVRPGRCRAVGHRSHRTGPNLVSSSTLPRDIKNIPSLSFPHFFSHIFGFLREHLKIKSSARFDCTRLLLTRTPTVTLQHASYPFECLLQREMQSQHSLLPSQVGELRVEKGSCRRHRAPATSLPSSFLCRRRPPILLSYFSFAGGVLLLPTFFTIRVVGRPGPTLSFLFVRGGTGTHPSLRWYKGLGPSRWGGGGGGDGIIWEGKRDTAEIFSLNGQPMSRSPLDSLRSM